MSQATESMHPTELSPLDAAIEAASQQPTDSTLWDAAEDLVVETQKPEPLADLYAEVLGRELGAPALRELSERALLFVEEWFADETPHARAVLRRVFARNPHDEALLERLALGLTSARAWDDLMDVYDQALDATDSLEEKAKLLAEAARVAKDVAEDVDRAVDYLERLLPLRPADGQLRQSLERLLAKEQRWSQLIALWESGLEDLTDDEAAALRVRIARCWLDSLRNPPAAVDVLVDAASRHGAHPAICEALEHICQLDGAGRTPRARALACVRGLYTEASRNEDLARVLRLGVGFEQGEAREQLLQDLITTLRALDARSEVLERLGQLFEGRPDDDALLAEVEEAAAALRDAAAHVDVLLRAAAATEALERRDHLALRAAAVAEGAGLAERASEVFVSVLDTGASEDVRRSAGAALVALLRDGGDASLRVHALRSLAALTEDPERWSELMGELARLCAQQGDYEQALSTWQQRLDRDESDAEALDGSIEVLRAAERFEPLVTALRTRIEQRADDAAAGARDLADLASIQVGPLGDLEAALSTWRELAGVDVRALQKTDGAAVAAREAEATFGRAAALQVAVADALGEVWGDRAAAADHYARALRMDPSHEGAQQGLRGTLEDDALRPLAADALGRAYRDTAHVDGQLEVLAARVEAEPDARKRRALWLEAATLSEQDKSDLKAAFDQQCHALLCLPLDPGCDDDVARLAEATGELARYADVLRQARDALEPGPRRSALTEREADLRETSLSQGEEALGLFQELLAEQPAREPWARAVLRLAWALEQWPVVATAVVSHTRALGHVPDGVLDLVPGDAESPPPLLCAALAEDFAHATDLPAEVRRALHVRLGRWCELSGSESDLTEQVWARALEAGQPDADILEHLVALRRGRPDRQLFDTLIAWSEQQEDPMDALREAAELAHQTLTDEAAVQQALTRLLAYATSARGRQHAPERARELSAWAVSWLSSIHEQAGDHAALLAVLGSGAALEPAGDDTLEFGLRAAKLSREILQDDQAALAAYARLFEQRPDHPETARALSGLYEQAGRDQEALVVLQRALVASTEPSWRSELRLWIARVAGRIESVDPRVSVLRDNLRDQSGHPDTMEALEGVLRERGDLNAWYDTLVEQASGVRAEGDADRPAVLYRQAALVARDELSDAKRALAAFVKVAELAPEAEVFDAIATLYEQRQEADRATSWLSRLLQQDPEQVSVRMRLARAHEAGGDLDAAEACLRAGVRAQPTEMVLRDALSDMLERRGHTRPLADLLSDTARHVQDQASMLAHTRRAASLYDQLGQPELGVDILEQAVQAVPEDRPLKCAYADALIAAQRLDEARALLQEMVEAYGRRRSPERAELHLRLSRAARAAGETEEALTQLDAAAGMSRGDVPTLLSLAKLAESASEWERAEKALRSLMMVARRAQEDDSVPSAGEVQFRLHRIAKAQGQEERAQELLDSAIEMASQSERDSARFTRTLLEAGEHQLLLQVLEARLEGVTDAATEARVLADLAEVLEGPLGRAEEALDARLKSLTAAPLVSELHTSAVRLAVRIGALERYTDRLHRLLERVRRKGNAEGAAFIAMQLGAAYEEHGNDPRRAREAYAHVDAGTALFVDAQLGVARLSGDRDEERRVLQKLLESEGVDAQAQIRARYRLLELLVLESDGRDSALDSVQELLSQFPDSHMHAAHVLEVACDADPHDGRAPALYEEVSRKSNDSDLMLRFFERHARSAEPSLRLIREGTELARERNDYAGARALCERAVELAADGPGLVDALWALSELSAMAREQGDMDGAIAWLRRAADAADGEEAFVLGAELAQLASAQGQGELARHTYEKLHAREPGERRIYRPLFTLHREAGDLAGARELVRATTEALLGPQERNELRAELAEMAFSLGDTSAAEQALREALEDDPDDERCSLLLADHLEREGRQGDLADLLSRKLEIAHAQRSPSIVPLSLRMGSLLRESRPDDAVQVYRTALSVVPEDPGLLLATVNVMDPEEQAAERAVFVERLLDGEPPENAPELALWLLDHAANHGSEDDVGRAMALGFKVAPGDESLRQRLEQWYRERENWPKLSEMLVTQAERTEDSGRALELLREAAEVVLERLGDPQRAAEILRRAREHAPDDAQLLRLTVLSSVRAGQAEQALSDLTEALASTKRKKKRVPLHLLRAEAMAEAGDPLGAVDDLEAAFKTAGAEVAEPFVRGLSRARAAAEQAGDAERERALLMRAFEVARKSEAAIAPTEDLASWVARHPDDVDAALQVLELQVGSEAWSQACQTAEKVLEAGELDQVRAAARRLFEAAQALGQPALAARGLERALTRFAGDATLRDQLAAIYEAVGANEHLALLLLNHLPAEDQPDERFEVLRRAGSLLLAAERPADAMGALEAALALKPGDSETLLAVIDTHIQSGSYQKAQALLEQAMENIRARRSPELAELRFRMSVLCDLAGDQRARYEWLAVALEADMNNGTVAAETAMLAQELGEVDMALKALRAVTMVKTECPMSRAEAFLRQAQIVAHKGETRRAALWAKKAKAEDPEFPGVDELLASLGG